MTLKQLELRCISNTVHFVLNAEHSKDALLNSKEVREQLGQNPHTISTPKWVDAEDVARDCDIFGCWLMNAFNKLVCRKYIQHSKNCNDYLSKLAHHSGNLNSFHIVWIFMAKYNQKYFEVTKPSGFLKTFLKWAPALLERDKLCRFFI